MKRLAFCTAIVFVALATVSDAAHAQKRLKVVASITIIQDIAKNVAGDKADIDYLVPTDGDAHEFEPKAEDVRKIADADLVLVNGVGLEQFLDKLIANAQSKATIVTVSRGLPIQRFQSIGARADGAPTTPDRLGVSGSFQCGAPKAGEAISECDPHTWQNVTNVIVYALNIRNALTAADPANTDAYNTNVGAYIGKLQALDAAIFAGVQAIPTANRVLVTNHDALGYYATRYGFAIAGVVLPGGTTGQEPSAKDVAALIETIKAKGVKAIFLENVASDKFSKQIADGAGVAVVQALYTDALGAPGTPGETYIGMMTANLKTLVDALR